MSLIVHCSAESVTSKSLSKAKLIFISLFNVIACQLLFHHAKCVKVKFWKKSTITWIIIPSYRICISSKMLQRLKNTVFIIITVGRLSWPPICVFRRELACIFKTVKKSLIILARQNKLWEGIYSMAIIESEMISHEQLILSSQEH